MIGMLSCQSKLTKTNLPEPNLLDVHVNPNNFTLFLYIVGPNQPYLNLMGSEFFFFLGERLEYTGLYFLKIVIFVCNYFMFEVKLTSRHK